MGIPRPLGPLSRLLSQLTAVWDYLDASEPTYNLKSYGALGNGSTDDTTAIAAALTAAQSSGGMVWVPPGDYLVEGSGSSIFTISKSIRLVGVPGWSRILVKSSVPNTRDVITYTPTDAGGIFYPTARANRFFTIDGLSITSQNADNGPFNLTPPAGTGGRYPLVIRSTATTGQYIHNFRISDCYFGLLNGSASVYLDNSAGNPNGIFTSTLGPNNIFERGIKGDLIGDTINVSNNNFRGSEYAVDASFASGVTTFNFLNNNVISNKGLRFKNGYKINIKHNIVELFMTGAPGSNGAVIDLDGTVGAIEMASIEDNVISAIDSISGVQCHGVRVNNALATSIRDNRFWCNGKYAIKPVTSGNVIQRGHNLLVPGTVGEIDMTSDTTGYSTLALFDANPSPVFQSTGGTSQGWAAPQNLNTRRIVVFNNDGVTVAGLAVGNGTDTDLNVALTAVGSSPKYARVFASTNSGIIIGTNNLNRLWLHEDGHLTWGTDNAHDIGRDGAGNFTRPRNLHLAGYVQAASGLSSHSMGGNVASASAITPTGNLFHVTGTTNITSITATGVSAGTQITMIFDATLTVVDGNNLILAGDFTTTTNDTLTLKYDGSNWYELSRSVN